VASSPDDARTDGAWPGVCHRVALAGSGDPARVGNGSGWGLIVSIVAASVTIMLSGYATGGQMGLPLAGALAGAWASGSIVHATRPAKVPLATALGGLFSLLVVGRFFARLTSVHAILLFYAPILCVAFELPFLRRLAPWSRTAVSMLLVGILAAGVVVSAWIEFVRDSH
jgi:hypothetical protein